MRAILGALNPDMDIDDELGYVGRGGQYRAPAAPAEEVDNRQSRRAPLQNTRAETTTEMTDDEIDKEFDEFMLMKYGFKYDDQPPA